MGSQSLAEAALPYWQVNIPPHLRTTECPPFLQNVNTKDLSIISTPDSSYTLLPWSAVQSVIASGRIGDFIRKPSDLRNYQEYLYHLKQRYGSVIEFVLKERLHWDMEVLGDSGVLGLVVRGEKWASDNVKVLWNDWPYGIDERIAHLVVWTKFWLDEIPGEDKLVPDVEEEIVKYVDQTFVKSGGMKPENVSFFLPLLPFLTFYLYTKYCTRFVVYARRSGRGRLC